MRDRKVATRYAEALLLTAKQEGILDGDYVVIEQRDSAANHAIVVALMLATPRPDIVDAMPPDDMDILLGEDSIEMLEDLEFYSLLDVVAAEEEGNVG